MKPAIHSGAPAEPGIPGGERFRAAYRVLQEAAAAHAFPGCAFGVYAAGKVVLQDALGCFTYDDGAAPVTAETVYDLASVTKVAATTAMAMLLVQRGRLAVDDRLGDWLRGFVVGRSPGDRARDVRLRHLLAHNSGLPGYVEFFRSHATAPALLRACLRLPLEAEPGARAEYSDPGFILLGKALEVCAGERLDAWTRREIFAPLAMRATCFCPQHAVRASIAPTERASIAPAEEDAAWRKRRMQHEVQDEVRDEVQGEVQGEVQDENAAILGGVAGHAGLFSNVPDLLRFSAAVLRAGDEDSAAKRLFHEETVAAFAARQEPAGSSRALGWDTPSENSSSGVLFSARSIGHLGYSGCSLWIDLESRIAVVLLTNRTWPDRASQLIRQVRPAFHDAVRGALD